MKNDRRKKTKWDNLFLVRHGESTANEVNRFAGAIDAPLTDLGIAQAFKAAKCWKGDSLDKVFVSPLIRASHTAEILLNSIPQIQGSRPRLDQDARLRERHFGDFTLQNKTLVQRRVGLRSYEAALYSDKACNPGGEEFIAFHDRVLDFLKNELHPLLLSGKKVLVVAHKYVIELLSRFILRLLPDEGHDIRLPNATILNGSSLTPYINNESRTLNMLQDWIVMYHSIVILCGVFTGLVLKFWIGEKLISPLFAFSLLSAATVISLIRVTLLDLRVAFDRRLFPGERVLFRFALLPLAVGVIGQFSSVEYRVWILSFALLLAAPTAITVLTISRSGGGMVQPSVYMIILSTLVSAMVMFPILDLYGQSGLAYQALIYVVFSVSGLFLPLLIAFWMRKKHPVSMAKFAERNAATAILLLTLFVIVAIQSIDLTAFFPYGVLSFIFGVMLRVVAFLLSRHKSLYAIDDYLSMAYPNIFLVILLAQILGFEEVVQLAGWFLIPMFALSPLDDYFCKKLQKDVHDPFLQSFLKISEKSNNKAA